MIRHRAVKAGLAVVVLAGAVWGIVALARPSARVVMPTGTPSVTVPIGDSHGVALVRLGEGSRTLVVNLAACGAIRNAVDVSEDASRVLLSARTTGGSDAFCSDGVTVFLTQELGQRTVVDGHSGQPVSVEGR